MTSAWAGSKTGRRLPSGIARRRNRACHRTGIFGRALLQGEGVLEDVVEGYKWLLLAGASGSDSASKARAIFAKKITPEQIAEAQRQSKEFLEGKQENPESAEQPRRKTVLNCKASGTGYFITPNGFILTACHVISEASKVEVRTKSGDLEAKIIHADPANDIAVLKVEGSFPAISLENSKTVKLGDAVITIGFPNIQLQGFSPKLTKARSIVFSAFVMIPGISK